MTSMLVHSPAPDARSRRLQRVTSSRVNERRRQTPRPRSSRSGVASKISSSRHEPPPPSHVTLAECVAACHEARRDEARVTLRACSAASSNRAVLPPARLNARRFVGDGVVIERFPHAAAGGIARGRRRSLARAARRPIRALIRPSGLRRLTLQRMAPRLPDRAVERSSSK